MSAVAHTDEEFMDFLIQQIINLPEGTPCFLCATTHCKECIWEEIGDEMLLEGNKIIEWYKNSKVPTTHAKMHRAVRYHLYQHYACAVTGLGRRGVRIQVPECIEKYIKLAYPGDGKFVGFKKHPTKKFQSKVAVAKTTNKSAAAK